MIPAIDDFYAVGVVGEARKLSVKSLKRLQKTEDRPVSRTDLLYVPEKDVYRCPAGEQLTYRFSAVEHGMTIRRYWTTACPKCRLQARCTTGPMRRIPRWDQEQLLEVV